MHQQGDAGGDDGVRGQGEVRYIIVAKNKVQENKQTNKHEGEVPAHLHREVPRHLHHRLHANSGPLQATTPSFYQFHSGKEMRPEL